MADNVDDIDVRLTEAESARAAGTDAVVLMRADVFGEIDEHAGSDLDHEVGGVLLGTAACSAEGTLVFVEAAIRALRTDASRGSVTFTHDTWAEINRIKDEEYPDKRIVGWYHSHPGFGIFLSEHDLFIHRNFFNVPWQVALVVDPRAKQSGFFVWREGELVGPGEFEVVGALPAESAMVAAAPDETVPAPRQFALGAWRWWVAAALAVLVVFATVEMAGRLRPAPAPDAIADELASVRTEVSALEREVADLAKRSEPAPAQHSVYTVKRGDNLWRIAQEKYGDGAKWGAIAIANGIGSGEIEPGMVLMIPQLLSDEGNSSRDD